MFTTVFVQALLLMGLLLPQAPAPTSASPSLDYDTFKTKIEPIFLAKRPGHARCVSCHSAATGFRLQPLAAGSTMWTEEETRKNFESVKRVAMAGNAKSRILLHPLAEAAGGDFFHSGGKHWQSQNDPEWQTLRAWVLGQPAASGK